MKNSYVSIYELRESMRYIAVFTLFAIPVAKGFSSLKEAIDCLKRKHDDPDTIPLGVYDTTLALVVSKVEDEPYVEADDYIIVRSARAYVSHVA